MELFLVLRDDLLLIFSAFQANGCVYGIPKEWRDGVTESNVQVEGFFEEFLDFCASSPKVVFDQCHAHGFEQFFVCGISQSVLDKGELRDYLIVSTIFQKFQVRGSFGDFDACSL